MNCQKHLFNLRENIHYLNCARKSPLLKSAEEACINALKRGRNPVDISIDDFFDEANQVRAYFGEMVNCESANVAIIPSTSYGFSSVLNNISPKKNGKAISIHEEFPSGYFSLKRWCSDNQNELVIVSPDADLEMLGQNWNDKLVEEIDENTSIVLISAIHWMNGLKFDLKRIGEKCATVGAKFIVDGTQAVGALPLDVKECHIDALVCATYKWLYGPYSIALAYISDSFSNGVPLEEAWHNRTNAKDFSGLTAYDPEYKPNAGRFNVGESSNFVTMPIMKEGLRQLLEWKVEAIQNYCKELIQPLVEYLSTLNITLEEEKYFSNHLFSLKLPPAIDTTLLTKNLEKNNIIISLRGKFIRVSVNVFNDEKDIRRLIETIEETLRLKVEN